MALDEFVFACVDDSQCAPDKVCHPATAVCVDSVADVFVGDVPDGDLASDHGLDDGSGPPDVESDLDEEDARDVDGDVGTPGPVSCQAYCQAATIACTGQNRQYRDFDECLGFCSDAAGWEPGSASDSASNTLGCRLQHAEEALLIDPESHCSAAGPSGGGVCGSWCDVYCGLTRELCTGAQQLFTDASSCRSACEGLAAGAAPGGLVGDSVQCRLAYLTVLGLNPEAQEALCAAADPAAGACVPVAADQPAATCANLCAVHEAGCRAEAPQYASGAGCMAACADWAGLAAGTPAAPVGNTIACRIQHMMGAFGGDATTHCAPGAIDGRNICGSWCDNYCDLALRNCTGEHQLFATRADCAIACAGMSRGGQPGDLESDTVQCRLTWLLAARSDPAGVAEHCGAASAADGGLCAVEPPSCGEYCGTIQSACGDTGALASQYADAATCNSYCDDWAAIPLGAAGDTTGNTVGCRLAFARAALEGDVGACAVAGPTGGDVCGSWCDNYCYLAMTHCTDGDALYPNLGVCMNTCAELPSSGEPTTLTGDSVQCRINHLFRAGDDSDPVPTSERCLYASKASVEGGCR